MPEIDQVTQGQVMQELQDYSMYQIGSGSTSTMSTTTMPLTDDNYMARRPNTLDLMHVDNDHHHGHHENFVNNNVTSMPIMIEGMAGKFSTFCRLKSFKFQKK